MSGSSQNRCSFHKRTSSCWSVLVKVGRCALFRQLFPLPYVWVCVWVGWGGWSWVDVNSNLKFMVVVVQSFVWTLSIHRGVWHCVQGSAGWNGDALLFYNRGSENFKRLAVWVKCVKQVSKRAYDYISVEGRMHIAKYREVLSRAYRHIYYRYTKCIV